MCRCDVRPLDASGIWVMHVAVTSRTDCLMLRYSLFSERAGDFVLGEAEKLKPGSLNIY